VSVTGERAVTAQAREQAAWLTRNAVDSLPEGELAVKLSQSRPLRVKFGVDPTAPDIHVGHTVVFQKLREFQDLGHRAVLIIGDYTARVGDPSGRSALRPMLAPAEIDANARTYQEQALKILDPDPDRLEVRFNGEWLDMSMESLFALVRTTTVGQLLERDDFARRYAAHEPISVLEMLYPLIQGYDSVAVRSDVELGGTDQKFNLLLARDIQRAYGCPQQVALTMPLLTGIDGERKMSKSYDNHVGISDPPEEMYGRTLSIPDESLPTWYDLLLSERLDPARPPRDAKRALARALVTRFHDESAAREAEERFDAVHVRHEVPDDVPVVEVAADSGGRVHLPALLRAAFGVSTSEARRAVGQGAVRIDGERVALETLDIDAGALDGHVLQLGKRRFARIRIIGPGGPAA
jgi:tyrosyl-tRNA synthetase